MNLRQLKADASAAVDRCSGARQVALLYAGIVTAISALVTIVNFCLELNIAQMGGLSNIGTRSILATIQSVLPMTQSIVLLCLELGFLSAVLRVVRGQYVSPNSLRLGFARFWPLMRLTVLQSMIYMGIGFISIYISVQLFLLTPLSDNAMIIATSMIESGAAPEMTDAVIFELLPAMLPMLPILALIYLALMLPIYFKLRMASYVLIDKPRCGALAAMGESRMMMRGNALKVMKLDISFWWYYLLSILATALAYGDVICALAGIELPWSDTVSYFLFYGLYLVLQFGLFYFFLSRVTAAYALTYDVIRPKPEPSQGVVLGNIFDLAREQ